MILLTAQFDKMSGPDSVGAHKLVLSMDESVNQGAFNPMQVKKGTQFVVMMIECGTEEHDTFVGETKDETLERFRKHMHALITDVAKQIGATPEEFKETIKRKLKEEGKIKESTKELNLEQLADIINKLKNKKAEYDK